MRRSTRIVAASTEKKAKRMAPLIRERSKRLRKEPPSEDDEEEWEPDALDDEYEEGEEEEEGEAEEDEAEEDDDDDDFSEEEEKKKPKRSAAAMAVTTRVNKQKSASNKRRTIEISDSDSSDQDGGASVTIRPPPSSSSAAQKNKVREIMIQKNGGVGIAKPKSILKKSTKFIEEPPNMTKNTTIQGATKRPRMSDAKDTAAVKASEKEDHRRPMKQRGQRDGSDQPSTAAVSNPAVTSLLANNNIASTSNTSTNTLDHFFEEILEWNFFEALIRESQKDFLFSEANDGSEEGEVEQIAQVPSQFRSYDHYFSVWKPLALQEVQAQTINNVSQDSPQPIPITATGFGVTFLGKTCKIRVEMIKQGTSRFAQKQMDQLMNNDLVLISPSRRFFQQAAAASNAKSGDKLSSDKGGGVNSSAEDAKPPIGMLGIVLSQKASREGLRLLVLGSNWRSVDQEGELFLFKLSNLTTSVREFRALCDCRDYQLMPLLLSGKHQKGSMRLDSLGGEYVRWLNKTFNESQLEAITAAATSEGFTLIKGPPGTGKTTTLKGLLNSLHLREYSRYYNAVLDVARRPDHETNKAWAAIGNEKPHILVTAPSNAAVDNIVGKVIEEGFCDGEGRRYFPKIVRVGRGLSANVRAVGLDELIEQICGHSPEVIENKVISLSQQLRVVEHDSVSLRDHLRKLVEYIDNDPEGVLAAQEKAMALQHQLHLQHQQQAQQPSPHPEMSQQQAPPPPPGSPPALPLSPPPPPPPTELLPLSPTYIPGSPPADFNSWSSPSSPTLYPSASPPGPPSPSILPTVGRPTYSFDMSPSPHSPASNGYDVEMKGESAGYHVHDEEEEEDEAFPVPSFAAAEKGFNTEETSKAFSNFFGDGSSEDEDEPLPTKQEQPPSVVVKDEKSHDQSPPPPPPPPADSLVQLRLDDDEDMDEPEEDEPLPSAVKPSSDVIVPAPGSDEPAAIVPISPPPAPPMSPPPPPLESPPPMKKQLSVLTSEEVSASSSKPEPEPKKEDVAMEAPAVDRPKGPIDYTKYHQYRVLAQQINACLERLSELKLELQRYQFARKAVNERGKMSQAMRQSLEVSFLDTAHIVFTTLSSAGVAALDASSRYDVLVVDEAAQAVELSTIIPMKFGSRQCVLVGDPQQLSATVFSRTSGQTLYERSLFERIEMCDHPVHMLREQYRSHPLISDFPRHYFYGGKLQDGANVQTEAYDKPYHHLGAAFMPLTFWNLMSSRESSSRSVSRSNAGEAELAVNLYLTLKNSCPPDAIAGKVGMITPYSQQQEELRTRFRRALGDRFDQEVEINTVDGFQGREKDIIILSTVRADPKGGVGFLNDIRRMNVALTRAKFACYVIGSEPTLRSSKPWAALLDHSYKKNCIVHVENPQCNLLTLQPMVNPAALMATPAAPVHRRTSPPLNVRLPSGPGQPPTQFVINGDGPPQFLPAGGQWSPPTFNNAQPHQHQPGSGWRGRGRGHDGMRGGRRGGRGGRGSPGRGRGGRGGRNGGSFNGGHFAASNQPQPHRGGGRGELNMPPPQQQQQRGQFPPNSSFPPPPAGKRPSPPPVAHMNSGSPAEGILGHGQPQQYNQNARPPPPLLQPPVHNYLHGNAPPPPRGFPPPPPAQQLRMAPPPPPPGGLLPPPPSTVPPPVIVRPRDPRQRRETSQS